MLKQEAESADHTIEEMSPHTPPHPAKAEDTSTDETLAGQIILVKYLSEIENISKLEA